MSPVFTEFREYQKQRQRKSYTSAATVAVLPEAEDVDVEIKEVDPRIDVFRAGGPGGQSVILQICCKNNTLKCCC